MRHQVFSLVLVSTLTACGASHSGQALESSTDPVVSETATHFEELEPDISAQPYYKTLNLSAGFAEDPTAVELQAGGNNPVFIEGCNGYINASNPDVDLNYEAGDYPLAIYVNADYDTTLLVNQPDGSWICDDDAGSGSNPALLLEDPQAGLYDIWVGTYDGQETPEATLYFSEVLENANAELSSGEVAMPGPGASGPDYSADPTYGTVDLQSGFDPDPSSNELVAGGNDQVTLTGCNGYILAAAPDLRVNYESGELPVSFYVTSEVDTTLVISLPDGEWACDDDTHERNPAVTLQSPQSGQYDIWVGTYNQGENSDALLHITEYEEIPWSGTSGKQ